MTTEASSLHIKFSTLTRAERFYKSFPEFQILITIIALHHIILFSSHTNSCRKIATSKLESATQANRI